MSAEQFRHGADLQGLVRPICPAPPDVPAGTPPQRSAGPPTVLALGEHESTRPHRLAALRTGRGMADHAAHPNERRPCSRAALQHDLFVPKHASDCATCGQTGRDLGGPSASVSDCAPWYGTVVAQLDTQPIPTPRMTRTADGPPGARGTCTWTPQLGRTKPAGFEPASSRFWRPRATTSALRLHPTGILVPLAMREAYGRSSAGPTHAFQLCWRGGGLRAAAFTCVHGRLAINPVSAPGLV